MTLALANPLGWAYGEILASSQQNALQNELIKALDGAGGGPYAPSAALVISGQGFRLAGVNHQVTGTLTVKSGGTLVGEAGSNLNHSGTADFDGDVRLGHDAGDDIDVDGLMQFSLQPIISGLAYNGITAADNDTTTYYVPGYDPGGGAVNSFGLIAAVHPGITANRALTLSVSGTPLGRTCWILNYSNFTLTVSGLAVTTNKTALLFCTDLGSGAQWVKIAGTL